jgi:ribonuclease J
MPTVTLTVHRATQTIGGNCIEIATSEGNRLILDMGRPLDAPREATGLLPETLDVSSSVDGVLVSHPHLDHYGLLEELPGQWPVWCGAASASLMRLTTALFGQSLSCDFQHWQSGVPVTIGAFTVTPFLTDHSAFDAYMLQIDVAGKRIFYTGDFRLHGRKGALVERLMASPPANIDALLMEGTNLGSDKPCMAEADLETSFVELFRQTAGRVFVNWSAQNIDRTVTLYRACLKTQRTLVVDLYTADVLETLAKFGKIPQPDWNGMRVLITSGLSKRYKQTGRAEFVDRMAKNGIGVSNLHASKKQWVVMTRSALMRDFQRKGIVIDAEDAWSWSNWRGYLAEPQGAALQAWFDDGGATANHIHTSGHASTADLKAFSTALNPKTLVPIHGLGWDEGHPGFPAISRLGDGEAYVL